MINKLALMLLDVFDFFHKRKIVNFLKKKKINHLKSFFDIGAHQGESIELFTRNFLIEKIYSFEPSKENFEILLKKIKYIDLKETKLIIENYALGEEEKEQILFQTTESSSSTINRINKNSKYFKKKNFFLNLKKEIPIGIKQIKLSDYMKKNNIRNLDFIKIDTEGYEYFVLLGAEQYLKEFKYIIFEHHYDDMIQKKYKFSQISKILKENGFQQMLKLKMPLRKTFEYIYFNKKVL